MYSLVVIATHGYHRLEGSCIYCLAQFNTAKASGAMACFLYENGILKQQYHMYVLEEK